MPLHASLYAHYVRIVKEVNGAYYVCKFLAYFIDSVCYMTYLHIETTKKETEELTMQLAHHIDFSDPGIKGDGARMAENEVVRFVRGVRRPRTAAVSAQQIRKWFRHTPDAFVDAAIDAALLAERIVIRRRTVTSGRRANGGYVYEIPAN